MTILIAVGIGNTTVSWGLPVADEEWPPTWIERTDRPTDDFDPALLETFLEGGCRSGPRRWFVSSVQRQAEERLSTWLARNHPDDSYHVLRAADLALRTAVRQPERVGMDRLLAAMAADRLREAGRPAVVIDAGTAITMDLLNGSGVFQGGIILSGLQMSARALASFTDLLPEVDCRMEEPPEIVGRDTEQAIQAGLFYGGVGAIRECLGRIEQSLDESPQVFVTGGGARNLVAALGVEHQFIPDLVLSGVVLAARALD